MTNRPTNKVREGSRPQARGPRPQRRPEEQARPQPRPQRRPEEQDRPQPRPQRQPEEQDRPQPRLQRQPEDSQQRPRFRRPEERPQRRPQDRPLQRRLHDERSATFFVSTVHGLEDELAAEMSELAEDLNIELPEPPKVASAGVVVRAPWNFAIAMNFGLRCGSRVLCEVLECEVQSLEDVYAAVEKLNWPSFFSPDKTFVVASNSSENKISAPALTLKIKDALVDSFRKQTRERPSVDKDAPQVRVMARLHRRTLTVSLDTTGTPLAQRGYRVTGGDAPLGELLAAGLVRMTGWTQLCRALRHDTQEKVFFSRVEGADSKVKAPLEDSQEDSPSDKAQKGRRIPAAIPLAPEFVDPMCGTGTFSIEAALQLLNRRPQIERKFFCISEFESFSRICFTPNRIDSQTAACAGSFNDRLF